MSASQSNTSHRGIDFGIPNVQATVTGASSSTPEVQSANNEELFSADSFSALQSYNDRVRSLSQQHLPGFGNLAPVQPTEISDVTIGISRGEVPHGIAEPVVENQVPLGLRQFPAMESGGTSAMTPTRDDIATTADNTQQTLDATPKPKAKPKAKAKVATESAPSVCQSVRVRLPYFEPRRDLNLSLLFALHKAQ